MGAFDQYATPIPAKPIILPRCQQCGEEFKPSTKWQKFCTTKCRATWFRVKSRQKESVFCDMTNDSQPEEIKDDAKKPTIDVFGVYASPRPPAHEKP